MFLGLDSSTQSLTAVVIDPATSAITCQLSISFGKDLPHYHAPSGFIPGGTGGEVHANPLMWLEALDLLLAKLRTEIGLQHIKAVAGSGQQHGSVYLDASFDERLAKLSSNSTLVSQLEPSFTRATSPIWMDTSTGEECAEITRSLGGAEEICRRSGSVAVERFTGPQIRRFYKLAPDAYAHTKRIHLVSSFIASVLAGKSVPVDFGDGAGMNLLNLSRRNWDTDLLAATAPDLCEKLLPPAETTAVQGNIAGYFVEKYGFSPNCQVALFTGDNPASLVGMGATQPGNVVISLGTSDTYFAAMPGPRTDPNGYGHVFGNPAGGYMSLICFRNGSLAREAMRDELGVDWSAFEKDALTASRDLAGKNLMLPFYGPEITPRHDFAAPVREGDSAFESAENPAAQIRALLEGQFLNMRLHAQWMESKVEKIRLTGGASKNDGIAQLVADVFQSPVERLDVSNSAALGAALIAAASAGHSLATLEAAFCKTEPGSSLEPDRSLAATYDDAVARFRSLLQANGVA